MTASVFSRFHLFRALLAKAYYIPNSLIPFENGVTILLQVFPEGFTGYFYETNILLLKLDGYHIICY
jgi:hypothetical protein